MTGNAVGFGLYALFDARTGLMLTKGLELTLDEAADFINRKKG